MGAMVPMLLVLVVIHELGHFFTARALGVKVLEFGVGFPPRAFAIYTGRTRVLFDTQTRFVGVDGPGALVNGQFVKISSSEDIHGNLVARTIEVPQSNNWCARMRSHPPDRQPSNCNPPNGSCQPAHQYFVQGFPLTMSSVQAGRRPVGQHNEWTGQSRYSKPNSPS